MRKLRAITVAFCAFVVLPTPGRSQGAPSAPTIVDQRDLDRWLHSDNPREIAWGAFLAPQYRDPGANRVPALVAALDRSPAARPWIVDALIQLRANLSSDVILRIAGDGPESLILLSNSTAPERNEILLARLPGARDHEWRAVANLLFESRAPGFAAALLNDVRLVVEMAVSDDGVPGVGGGAGGAACGDGIRQVHGDDGFPPIPSYEFSSCWSGTVVHAHGPLTPYLDRTSCYRRELTLPATQTGAGSCTLGVPSNDERVVYLNALAGARDEPILRTRNFGAAKWTSVPALEAAVNERRADVTRHWAFLLERLVGNRTLTRDEAERLQRPAVDVVLHDLRTDQSQPLPKISPR